MPRRPGARRDPYPVSHLFCTEDRFTFSSATPGLWVPAFAGTTESFTMAIADKLVLQRQHHLKWRAFDRLELILMMICGVLCFGFSVSVMLDIVTRTIGHPWLWLQ